MIKEFVNIGLKRLLAFRVYSLINISGFAIAVAVCLAILFFTTYHFSFDKYISDGENSYRIISRYSDGSYNANTFACFDDVLPNCPEVASHATIYTIHHVDEVYVGEDKIKCNELIFADTDFLNFFSAKMIEGDKQSINLPNTMFVTPKMAKKLFPDKNAVNQTVFVKSFTANRDSLIAFTITGIIKPLPETSHLGYEIILSQKGHFSQTVEIVKARKVFAAAVYVKLFQNTNIEASEKSIKEKIALVLKGVPGAPSEAYNHHLQAIHDIHFSSETVQENRDTIRRSSLYILLLVGLLIFSVAVINFVNIHIARAQFYRKQSGIIVFLGGKTKHLFSYQFIEVFISITISFIAAVLFLLIFNTYFGEYFALNWTIPFRNISTWLIILALYFVIVVLAALSIISIFIKKRKRFRKTNFNVPLIVFQFVLVIAMLDFTILINKQMDFINTKELGYSSENVIAIEIQQRNSKVNTFRDELKVIPGVISAATAQHYPGFRFQDMMFPNGDNSFPFIFGFIDEYAVNTLNINVLRYFKDTKEKSTDGWYINEHFYNKLRETYSDSDIATSNFSGSSEQANANKQKIELLGVLSDFHYASLHNSIENFAFYVPKSNTRFNRFVLVRINQFNVRDILTSIEQKMHEIYPGQAFNYKFINEDLNKKYRSELTLLRLINAFSILSIIIACLGLIGFTLFIIEKRTKEIGIRKVNGAKVSEVLIILNKDFIIWIAIAFVIATPIAWYAMQNWLQNFAYKTELNWWIFGLAGLLALLIAIITVSWQTFKAARRNPVEALRYE
jgi:putative ABC transport system permease protein